MSYAQGWCGEGPALEQSMFRSANGTASPVPGAACPPVLSRAWTALNTLTSGLNVQSQGRFGTDTLKCGTCPSANPQRLFQLKSKHKEEREVKLSQLRTTELRPVFLYVRASNPGSILGPCGRSDALELLYISSRNQFRKFQKFCEPLLIAGIHLLLKVNYMGNFPGGPVVNNLPASAEDTNSIPGLGRSHMFWSN